MVLLLALMTVKHYTNCLNKPILLSIEQKNWANRNILTFNDSYQDITPVTNYISKGWLIDELDEIVYVSSLDTYELLYLNRKGREITGIEAGEYNHIKCYEALQGRN